MGLRGEHVWVIGCPRSGTTVTAEVLAEAGGAWCLLDADWLLTVPSDGWGFGRGRWVVKRLELFELVDEIERLWPDSWWVCCEREARQAIHSMVRPKADSYPYREFPELGIEPERISAAWEARHRYLCGCQRVRSLVGNRFLTVRYECMAKDIGRILRRLGWGESWPAARLFANRNVPCADMLYLLNAEMSVQR